MGKIDVSNTIKTLQKTLEKHSPEILTGFGVVGMTSAIIFAVKATPKAMELIREDSRDNHDGDPNAYTKMEAVKSCWKCYIPTAVISTASIACLIGANSINHKRNVALATAYTLSEAAASEYKSKVVDILGEKKERAIKDEIAKDKMSKDPVTSKEIIITDKGNTLCYDSISGRYFKSNIDKIRSVENDLNRRMINDMYISLNDFYYEIGLPNISIGYELGWNLTSGFIDLDFTSQLADDGTPCLVIDYLVAPKYDYSHF